MSEEASSAAVATTAATECEGTKPVVPATDSSDGKGAGELDGEHVAEVFEGVLAEQEQVTAGAGSELAKTLARRRALSATKVVESPTKGKGEEAAGAGGGAADPPEDDAGADRGAGGELQRLLARRRAKSREVKSDCDRPAHEQTGGVTPPVSGSDAARRGSKGSDSGGGGRFQVPKSGASGVDEWKARARQVSVGFGDAYSKHEEERKKKHEDGVQQRGLARTQSWRDKVGDTAKVAKAVEEAEKKQQEKVVEIKTKARRVKTEWLGGLSKTDIDKVKNVEAFVVKPMYSTALKRTGGGGAPGTPKKTGQKDSATPTPAAAAAAAASPRPGTAIADAVESAPPGGGTAASASPARPAGDEAAGEAGDMGGDGIREGEDDAATSAAAATGDVEGEEGEEEEGEEGELVPMTATKILYHEAYDERFISLVDMLAVMPDLEIGKCALSGCDLTPEGRRSVQPVEAFVCPETAVFVLGEKAMEGTAVIASTASKQIELSREILFEGGRSNLREVSHGILEQMVRVLRDNPLRIRIEGHVAGPDEDDDEATNHEGDNYQLSHNRAQKVVDFLVERGVDRTLLFPKGCGASQPKNTDNLWDSANRRVEVHFLPEGATDLGDAPEGAARGGIGDGEGADEDKEGQGEDGDGDEGVVGAAGASVLAAAAREPAEEKAGGQAEVGRGGSGGATGLAGVGAGAVEGDGGAAAASSPTSGGAAPSDDGDDDHGLPVSAPPTAQKETGTGSESWAPEDVAAADMLITGFVAKKHGRRGKPKDRYFWIARDGAPGAAQASASAPKGGGRTLRLYWCEATRGLKKKPDLSRSVCLTDVTDVLAGAETPLLKQNKACAPSCCASLVGAGLDRGSLDLQFRSGAERDEYVRAATAAVARAKRDV